MDVIGEEKFNQFFLSSTSFPLTISQGFSLANNPIFYLFGFSEVIYRNVEGVIGKRPLKVGEECYFGGVPWYYNKHPGGASGGWNVIYIGDDQAGNQLFIGHGFKKPLTEKEINHNFIDLYNQERTPQDEKEALWDKPELSDKNINFWLKNYFTISHEDVEKNRSMFLKGYAANTVKGLQADKLVELKNSRNIDDKIKLKLINDKIFYDH